MSALTKTTLKPVETAAYDCVDSLVPSADDYIGKAPLWYGWALREAFERGAEWQRQRLIERLRAVDVERIAHVWAPGFIPGTAAQIREALIAAVTGGEE